MGSPLPKQYHLLAGKPVALHSFEQLCSHPEISEICVVCDRSFEHLFTASIPLFFARAGRERQDSLQNGFNCLKNKNHVLIHDAARPFLTRSDLHALIKAGKEHAAATLAHPAIATIKRATQEGVVMQTLQRDELWETQTPQMVRYDILEKGLEKIATKSFAVTDDVSIAELMGYPVKLVKGSRFNIKLTTPEDLLLAPAIYKSLQELACV